MLLTITDYGLVLILIILNVYLPEPTCVSVCKRWLQRTSERIHSLAICNLASRDGPVENVCERALVEKALRAAHASYARCEPAISSVRVAAVAATAAIGRAVPAVRGPARTAAGGALPAVDERRWQSGGMSNVASSCRARRFFTVCPCVCSTVSSRSGGDGSS